VINSAKLIYMRIGFNLFMQVLGGNMTNLITLFEQHRFKG
jgi:hypothetical protein